MKSIAAARRPPYGPFTTLLLGILLGALLFSAQLVATGVVIALRAGAAVSPDRFAQESTRGDVVSVAIVSAALVVSVSIALLVLVRRGPPLVDYLALGSPSLRQLAMAGGLAAALAALGDAWLLLLGRPIVHPSMRHALETVGGRPALLAMAVIVAAPISEELLFRGFLYRGWLPRFKPWLVALVSAVLWAGLHVQYGPPELVTIVVAGLGLGELRRRTGSLWPPLLCHTLLNVIASIETLLL